MHILIIFTQHLVECNPFTCVIVKLITDTENLTKIYISQFSIYTLRSPLKSNIFKTTPGIF